MFIEVHHENQIDLLASLARQIWREYFTPMIGPAQVDYMLDKFQSKEAISNQIKNEGYLYYLIEENDNYIGYMGVQPRENELFLSKIYVESSQRNKGYGKKALQFLEKLAQKIGLKKITLTVNKNNINTIKAYQKLGFNNLGFVVQDIGGGFIMDDYKMEKSI